MNTNLKGTGLQLDEKMKIYIEERVERLYKLINCAGKSVTVDIEIEKMAGQRKGNIFRAEIQFQLPYIKNLIRAEASGEDWRTAFDKARDKIKRELNKYKEKKC